jgi:DNA-binding transcriptional ArsR family regulator
MGNPAPKVEELLRALAEPQRIAILRLVHSQELPAGEIAARFPISRQAVSQHLRVLTNLGLLSERREANRRLYRVRTEAFVELRSFLEVFWANGLDSLKRRVEADKRRRT